MSERFLHHSIAFWPTLLLQLALTFLAFSPVLFPADFNPEITLRLLFWPLDMLQV